VGEARQKRASLRRHRGKLSTDEPYHRIGHARQHFPRTDRIERGNSGIKEDGDLKAPRFSSIVCMMVQTSKRFTTGRYATVRI